MARVQEGSREDLRRGVDFIGVCCVFWCHDGKGKVLLHKRSAACRDEQGAWDVGSGAMEFGEDFESAVRRELKEEYCVEPLEIKFLVADNVRRASDGKNTHWVALRFAVLVDSKKVKIGDPKGMDEIGWFTPDNLPSPLHSQFRRHYEFVKKA